MKKVMVSIVSVAALAGCSTYDYYKGGVRYTQDGPDCIYYSGEQGRHYSNDAYALNSGKKVVYRDTICAQLYKKDMAGQPMREDRKILSKAAVETPCAKSNYEYQYVPVAETSRGCNSCAKSEAVLKRRYVIVQGM